MKRQYLAVSFVLGLSTPFLGAYSNWEVLHTDSYKLYYDPSHKPQAIEALNELTLNRPLVVRIAGNAPKKFPVVLEDVGQLSNGYVTVFPEKMTLWLNQPSVHSFSINQQNSMRLLTTHELTHVAHLTAVSGNMKTLARIFGSLFYPNIYSPRWLTEGVAVYAESQNSDAEGRLNDGQTTAFFKAEGNAKHHADIAAMTLYGYSYSGANTPYLYGGRFIAYLSQTYGETSLSKFIAHYSAQTSAPLSLIAPKWSLEKSAVAVFGKSFEDLISEWQDAEIKSAETYSISGEKLTTDGWHKSQLKSDDKTLIYTQTTITHPYPLLYRPISRIVALNPLTQQRQVLYTSERQIEMPLALNKEAIYFVHPEYKKGYENIIFDGYGAEQTLYKLNKKTKHVREVLSDTITAFTVNNDDIVTYTSQKPGEYTSYLKQLRHATTRVLAELPLLVSELVVFDGDYYLVARSQFEPWAIYKVNGKTSELQKIVSASHALYAINCSTDGITFTSDVSKERHLYKYYFQTQTVEKLSSGNDAAKGLVFGDALYATTVSGSGEDIIKQPLSPTSSTAFQQSYTPYQPVYTLQPLSKKGFWESQEGLLKPHTRLGFINLGQDDLGLLHYSVFLSPFSGLSLSAYSKHFRPFTIGVQNVFNDYSAFISVPAYKSLSHGLQGLDFSVSVQDDASVYVGTIAGYGDTYQTGVITAAGSPAKEASRLTWDHTIMTKYLTTKLRFAGVTNDDQYDVLRGFTYNLRKDDTGYNLSADILFRLSTPRVGFWPITAGTEAGTFVGVFYDYSDYQSRNAQGLYLKQGTKWTLYNLGLTWALGQAYSDGDSSLFVTLELGYWF